MKHLCTILIIAFGAALAPGLAQSATGGGTPSGGSDPGPGAGPASPSQSSLEIKPGMDDSNGDTWAANENRSGNKCISISPASAGPETASTIRVPSSVTSVMAGVDANDLVVLGSNNDATITCTGGVIQLAGGGTTLTLHVTATPGASAARVELSGGARVFVAPGSSIVVTS